MPSHFGSGFQVIGNPLVAAVERNSDWIRHSKGVIIGAIADEIVAYGRPLIDMTDGSQEQMEKALGLTAFCYNLALTPEDSRPEMLRVLQSSLSMDDEEFEEFQRDMIKPMIRRHELMFPRMRDRSSDTGLNGIPAPHIRGQNTPAARKFPGTEPYAPGPCDSGKKYRFSCGKPARV